MQSPFVFYAPTNIMTKNNKIHKIEFFKVLRKIMQCHWYILMYYVQKYKCTNSFFCIFLHEHVTHKGSGTIKVIHSSQFHFQIPKDALPQSLLITLTVRTVLLNSTGEKININIGILIPNSGIQKRPLNTLLFFKCLKKHSIQLQQHFCF